MRHALPLLLAAAVFVSSAGCIGEGVVLGVGGGWADDWSVPASMAQPDRYTGVDVSVTPFPTILGYYHYYDSDASFAAPYLAWDLGFAMGLLTDETCWPVVKPVVGKYEWSGSPDVSGWLTGVKVGAAVRVSTVFYVSYEHGWFNAHDTVGGNDTRFQTARLAIITLIPQH